MLVLGVSQSLEFRSTFGSADLNVDYKEVEDGFSCRLEHWETTNFVVIIIFKKEEKLLNSFKFAFALFQVRQICFNSILFCNKFFVTITGLVMH